MRYQSIRPQEPKQRRAERQRFGSEWLYGGLVLFLLAWIGLFIAPAYIRLSPSEARVEILNDHSWHYPTILVHIVTASIAMVTAGLQIWPWVRNHRRAHIWIGRAYLFAGTVPAVITATALTSVRAAYTGDYLSSLHIGNTLWSILWLWASIQAFRAARSRNFHTHRRYAIYSFALATPIVWPRIAMLGSTFVPGFRDSWFTENVGWLFWVSHLILAQWYLNTYIDTPREPSGDLGSDRQVSGTRSITTSSHV